MGTQKISTTLYDMSVRSIHGDDTRLVQYSGQVLLIVNVASRCGFTPQYEGLERLFLEYHGRGFTVLGFPCNQFGGQEPGEDSEIQQFCSLTYHVSFPLFSKIDVNGPDSHPLYNFLKEKAPGLLGTTQIKWNFTKFLVSRDAKEILRFAPTTSPESLRPNIERFLAARVVE
jgi:glutathione peroxidase